MQKVRRKLNSDVAELVFLWEETFKMFYIDIPSRITAKERGQFKHVLKLLSLEDAKKNILWFFKFYYKFKYKNHVPSVGIFLFRIKDIQYDRLQNEYKLETLNVV